MTIYEWMYPGPHCGKRYFKHFAREVSAYLPLSEAQRVKSEARKSELFGAGAQEVVLKEAASSIDSCMKSSKK